MNNLIDMLKDSVCEVTFEKANGELRTMICTKIEDYIEYEFKGQSRPEPKDCVTVWDIEKLAFRRFKPSKVLSFKLAEGF